MSVVAEVERSGYHHNHNSKTHRESNPSTGEVGETKERHPSVPVAPALTVEEPAIPTYSGNDVVVSIPEYSFYESHQLPQQPSWCLPDAGVLFYPPQTQTTQPLQGTSETTLFYNQGGDPTEGRISHRSRSKPSGGSTDAPWDIKDGVLPMVTSYDPYDLWPDGNCRRVYSMASERARRHQSGWAMRNTNNHNPQVLKKSCLGVLVCSLGCVSPSGLPVAYRPAICDKARKKQCMRSCTTPGCKGRLVQKNCKGHGGYPVTHFWRFCNGAVFFQAKGRHDHVKPTAKALGSGAAATAAATAAAAAGAAAIPTGSGISAADKPVGASHRRNKLRLQTPSKIVPLCDERDATAKIAPDPGYETVKCDPVHRVHDASMDFQQHRQPPHYQGSELEALLLHQQHQQLLFHPGAEEALQPEVYFQPEQRQQPSLEYFLSHDQSIVEAPPVFPQAQGAFSEVVHPEDQYAYIWRPPGVQTAEEVGFLGHQHLQQEAHRSLQQQQQQQQQQQPYLGMLFAGTCGTYNTDVIEHLPALPENSGSTDASTVSLPGGVEGEVGVYPVNFESLPLDWSTTVGHHGQPNRQSSQTVLEEPLQMSQQQQQQLEQQAWFLNPHQPWKPVVGS